MAKIGHVFYTFFTRFECSTNIAIIAFFEIPDLRCDEILTKNGEILQKHIDIQVGRAFILCLVDRIRLTNYMNGDNDHELFYKYRSYNDNEGKSYQGH